MAVPNAYQELQDGLDKLNAILTSDEAVAIKAAIDALAEVVPAIPKVIDQLVALLDELQKEVDKLQIGNISGLTELSEVMDAAAAVTDAAKLLLKNDPKALKVATDASDLLSLVTALPTLDELKGTLTTAIAAVRAELVSIKPA